MNTTRTALIALACGVAAIAAAQSGTKASLTALYAKMDALTLKKDISGLKKVMTSTSTKDAVFADEKGKKKAISEMLDDMSTQMAMMTKISKSTSHIDKLVEKGSNATASVTSVLAFTMPIQGASHAFTLTSKSKDVWTKVGGAWKLKSSTEVSQTGTMDGKPVPQNAGG